MAKKVILEFTKGHGRYVKGDVAGFDPVKAAKLKSVTKPYDAEAAKGVDDGEQHLAATQDLDALKAQIEAARAELVEVQQQTAKASGAGTDTAAAGTGNPPDQGKAAAKK